MKERPILFSAPMVRAVLDGSKTQTRRALRHQPTARGRLQTIVHNAIQRVAWKWIPNTGDDGPNAVLCPYGVPGDRLWVREAWRVGKPHDHRSPAEVVTRMRDDDSPLGPRGVTVLYEAGGWKSVCSAVRPEPDYPDDEPMPTWAGKGRPSIHMPRAFSRITLEVVAVRVERLQEIGAVDARAEGLEWTAAMGWHTTNSDGTNRCGGGSDPIDAYRCLWVNINGNGSWDANPWVWVVKFRRAT